MELKKVFKIIVIISSILIIIDQTSKILISNFVTEDIVLIPNNTLTITKVENEGIAFGINKQNAGNIVVIIILLIIIFNYIISQRNNLKKHTVIYLSLMIAGGISNLIDRILKGAVFDFIKVGNFPVFNIADMIIVCGWFLFLIDFIKNTAIDIKTIKAGKKDKK